MLAVDHNEANGRRARKREWDAEGANDCRLNRSARSNGQAIQIDASPVMEKEVFPYNNPSELASQDNRERHAGRHCEAERK